MGALMKDEQGYLSPTPFGDTVDVLLTDALDSVLARYDSILVAHRLTSEPTETKRKLESFIAQGGNLLIVASSVTDLGGSIFNISVGDCSPQPSETKVQLANGSMVTEGQPVVFCSLKFPPVSHTCKSIC